MIARPNFLMIGAAKCATTSLCHILGKHPNVFMCDPKEPNFFARDREYVKGLDYYNGLFSDTGPATAIGEGSPTYTYCGVYPNTAKRIAKHMPHTKMIYIVRHPIVRARSHWLQILSNGHAGPRPLAEALRTFPACIDASLYWTQLNAYRDHFPDDRFLFLFFEEFSQKPLDTLKKCCEFLGVTSDCEMESWLERRNTTSESYQDRFATRLFRKVPFFSSVGMKMPTSFRASVRSIMRKKIDPGQAEWDEKTWQMVREAVQDDVSKFLAFVGKSDDFWDLEWGGYTSVDRR